MCVSFPGYAGPTFGGICIFSDNRHIGVRVLLCIKICILGLSAYCCICVHAEGVGLNTPFLVLLADAVGIVVVLGH